MLRHLPVVHPQPDAGRFIRILAGEVSAARPPLIEYLVDDVLMKPIVTEILGRQWVGEWRRREELAAHLDNSIQFWYRLGYDIVRFEENRALVKPQITIADSAPGSSKQRAWADEHKGMITTWEEFERYPWPRIEDVDFFAYEYINSHLPDGMGLIVCHGGGIFEFLSWIMSLEGLCLAIYENPALVKAVSDRLGEYMLAFYRHLLDLDRLVAVFPGDDMGFRSATIIAPAHLRQYTLPWHKRFAALTHARGLPYYLHSCGNLQGIMDDLINDVKIDGKHSFEDAIMPVDQFQERYGDRIACLGGLDVNILAAGSAEDVRRNTRRLMDTCGKRGRYAVGSGNSIPSYVPLENYLAMVDEALD